MFARFQDISEGGVDEEGIGINNVEKALARVGIQLRDSQNSFRNFTDVVAELSGKWKELDEVEKANIAKAMAGTRQRENLLILLENELMYKKLLTEETKAGGMAEQRYSIYLDLS